MESKLSQLKSFVVRGVRFTFFNNSVIRKLSRNIKFNRLYWRFYRTGYRILIPIFRRFYPDKYAIGDPFEIIWIPTQKINYGIKADSTVDSDHLIYGRVKDGDWHKDKQSLEEKKYFKNLKQYLTEEELQNQNEIRQDLIDNRLEQLEKVKEAIEKEGYKSQKSLLIERAEETLQKCNDSLFPELNDIQVVIGKEGDVLWRHCGKNRLFIAKILDIDKVPAIIQCRDKKWEEKRKLARENFEDLDSEILKHPDIENLLP